MGLLLAAGAALLGAVRGASRTQQTYWFNEVTKVTQWEEPPKSEFTDGRGWNPQVVELDASASKFQQLHSCPESWSSMRASSTGQP